VEAPKNGSSVDK